MSGDSLFIISPSWSSWQSTQLFLPIGHVALSRHDEHDPVHLPRCSCYAIISLITKVKRWRVLIFWENVEATPGQSWDTSQIIGNNEFRVGTQDNGGSGRGHSLGSRILESESQLTFHERLKWLNFPPSLNWSSSSLYRYFSQRKSRFLKNQVDLGNCPISSKQSG